MSEYMPPVSVVVPTYREEQYIEKCLESVRDQTYAGGVEIIVVDSDSPDRTRELAKRHADKVINFKERGVAKARNVGWKNASNEIVIFIDADTHIGKTFISEAVKRFADEGVVAVCPAVGSYDGTLFHKFFHTAHIYINRILAWLDTPTFTGFCAAYRKSALQEIGGYNEKLIVTEDVDVSLRIRRLGRCIFIPIILANTSSRRLSKMGNLNITMFLIMNYFERTVLKRLPNPKVYPHVEEISKTGNFLFILNQLNSYGSVLTSSDYYYRNYHRFSENMAELKYRIKKGFKSIGASVLETFLE